MSWLSVASGGWPAGHGGAASGRQLLETGRVLGLGPGVLALALLLVLSLGLCALGSRAKKPWTVYVSLSLLFLLALVILAASPKRDDSKKPAQGFDTTVIPRALLMTFMILGAVAGIAGIFFTHLQPTVYARPLSYHIDVLLRN